MKVHLFDKIISPHITEKSTNLSEQNKIIFKGYPKYSDKIKINYIFNVHRTYNTIDEKLEGLIEYE